MSRLPNKTQRTIWHKECQFYSCNAPLAISYYRSVKHKETWAVCEYHTSFITEVYGQDILREISEDEYIIMSIMYD